MVVGAVELYIAVGQPSDARIDRFVNHCALSRETAASKHNMSQHALPGTLLPVLDATHISGLL